ncbi:NUDIX hydrolase [Candidatus Saccharibacteria bacterium]|nr:NUDIX hydrolase [Candidatus Saccharibacteria bacterium]
MQRRNKDGTPGNYSLPKGKVYRKETLLDGALRELYEETGITAAQLDGELVETGIAYERFRTSNKGDAIKII